MVGLPASDDACVYPFLIPSNAAAVVALRGAAEICRQVWGDEVLAAECASLAEVLDVGIKQHGVVDGAAGEMFAYEVDGLGRSLVTDDANVPSLLSLPYLGYCGSADSTYLNTRAWLLSDANPHFFNGSHASGIGSPHTPEGHVWPIAIAIAALTSTVDGDVERALVTLEHTDGDTGRMHESFHVDDPETFTREWFSWADMTYAHLVLRSLGFSSAAD